MATRTGLPVSRMDLLANTAPARRMIHGRLGLAMEWADFHYGCPCLDSSCPSQLGIRPAGDQHSIAVGQTRGLPAVTCPPSSARRIAHAFAPAQPPRTVDFTDRTTVVRVRDPADEIAQVGTIVVIQLTVLRPPAGEPSRSNPPQRLHIFVRSMADGSVRWDTCSRAFTSALSTWSRSPALATR
jgi:hypothetical protein